MKKCILLLLLLFSLSGRIVFAQPVKITNLQLLNNELTFDVSWGASSRASLWSDSVWVFVDYYDVPSGEMLRLPVGSAVKVGGAGWGSSATVSMNEGSNSGFHVIGKAKSSGAGTVTVKVTATAGATISRPCVYATDYPPLVVYELVGADNVVRMKGTDPFCGVLTNGSSTLSLPCTLSPCTLSPGYRVAGFTDATGNEGVIQCGPTAQHTIALTSATNTQHQTVCAGTALTGTSYTIGGSASSVTVSNLPAGLTILRSSDLTVFSISGTPTETKTYTITTTGPLPECTPKTITGSVTINALPTVTLSANSTTICYNTAPTLTATVSGGTTTANTYTWNKLPSTPSTGTASTWSTGNLMANASYTVQVQNSNGCTSAVSNRINITAYANLNGGAISSNQTICSGDALSAITVSAPMGGSGTYTYLWYKNGATTGVTTAAYTPTDNANNATYTRVVTDSECGAATTTGSHVVTVNALPTVTLSANSTTICYNTAPTLTAAMSGGTTTANTYTWTKVDGSAATTTDNTWSTGNLTADASYTVQVQNSNGCTSAVSNRINITAYANLSGGAISSNQTICSGDALTAITVSAPMGGSGTYTYLWYKNGATTGLTTAAYTPTDNTNSATYTRVVTDSECGAATTTGSHVVTINALPTVTLSANSTTICYNTAPTLTATMSGGTTTANTYTWTKVDGSAATTTDNTWSTGNLTADASYTVQVQNSNGCTSVVSNQINISSYANFTAGAIATTGQTLCAGGTPTNIGSTTAASGGNNSITYSWYKNGTLISGATAATYTPPTADATAATSSTYTRKAKDGSCNTTETQSTGSWVLTVNDLPAAPSMTGAGSYCNSTNITATAGSGGSSIVWDNATTAGSRAISATGTYWAKSVSAAGCTSTAGSSVTIIIVTTPETPSIGQNGPKCAGTGVTFTASGSSGNYDWSSPATGSGTTKVSGTTAGAYTGTVRAYTTNGVTCYSATTSTTGTVNAAPTATVAALSISCNTQGTMSATVNAGSGSISSIRWYLGGVDQGTTTATTKATAALTATTNYYVTVTNSNGCTVTSAAQNITVGSCGPQNVTIAGLTWAGSNVDAYQTFAASATSYGKYYQWNRTTAFSTTNPISPAWTTTPAVGTTWTVNPCPNGWRIPTQAEFQNLSSAGNYWTANYNGVAGRWFGNTSGCMEKQCIFLPAAGQRVGGEDAGWLSGQNTNGIYWSMTAAEDDEELHTFLGFIAGAINPNSKGYRLGGFTIRCVK